MTEETKSKISESCKGKRKSAAHRAKISQGMKRYYQNESEEHRQHRINKCREYQIRLKQFYNVIMGGELPKLINEMKHYK